MDYEGVKTTAHWAAEAMLPVMETLADRRSMAARVTVCVESAHETILGAGVQVSVVATPFTDTLNVALAAGVVALLRSTAKLESVPGMGIR